MTVPSPEAIRQRQRLSLRAALQAALTVLPPEEGTIVVVPAAGDMSQSVFRKHCLARHPGIRFASIWQHALDHRTNPDIEHIHNYKGEDND